MQEVGTPPEATAVHRAHVDGAAPSADGPPAWARRLVAALCCLLVLLPAHAGERPAWPRHGPAERDFLAGHVMFVERRTDRWHAWVLPELSTWVRSSAVGASGSGWHGEVLDFFSGVKVDAELHEDELGHARPVFFSVGGVHAPAWAAGDIAVSRSLLREERFHDLRFADDHRLDGSMPGGCATRLMVVERVDPATRSVRWSRLLLRRSPPTAECPHGRWSSQVLAVLDLFDGTFLAALDDSVVRLAMTDLAPVGTGASVQVVDADVVAALLAAGGDVHERLNPLLPLPANPPAGLPGTDVPDPSRTGGGD